MLIFRINDKLLVKEMKVVFLHQLVALLNKFWLIFFYCVAGDILQKCFMNIRNRMVLVIEPRVQYARDISARTI